MIHWHLEVPLKQLSLLPLVELFRCSCLLVSSVAWYADCNRPLMNSTQLRCFDCQKCFLVDFVSRMRVFSYRKTLCFSRRRMYYFEGFRQSFPLAAQRLIRIPLVHIQLSHHHHLQYLGLDFWCQYLAYFRLLRWPDRLQNLVFYYFGNFESGLRMKNCFQLRLFCLGLLSIW